MRVNVRLEGLDHFDLRRAVERLLAVRPRLAMRERLQPTVPAREAARLEIDATAADAAGRQFS